MSRKQKADAAWTAAIDANHEKHCGKREVTPDLMAWYRCANSSGFGTAHADRDAVYASYDERLRKVQQDYELAGCY